MREPFRTLRVAQPALGRAIELEAPEGPASLWVPETRPGILSRRFALRDRIRRDAARPL
jgi:hypothetical protein